MKKQIIREVIFSKHYDGARTGFRFSDLPKDLLPDDFIEMESWDSYYGSDSSHDDGSRLCVLRERLETDEEAQARIDKWKEILDSKKGERRELYLKLKKEFDDE